MSAPTAKKPDLIGRTVNIISGWYEGHWGIIKAFDGERYHVSGGSIGEGCPIFDRDEFTMERVKNRAAVALGRRGGKVGGKAQTEAKAAAARENGRKGGRPKKQTEGK